MPFLEYKPDYREALGKHQRSKLVQSSLDRCKAAYLPLPPRRRGHEIRHEGAETASYSQAIEGVMEGICSVILDIGRSIETIWLRDFNEGPQNLDNGQVQHLNVEMQKWQDQIEELMAWLGWIPH